MKVKSKSNEICMSTVLAMYDVQRIHRQTVFVQLQCIVGEKYEKFIKKLLYAQFLVKFLYTVFLFFATVMVNKDEYIYRASTIRYLVGLSDNF